MTTMKNRGERFKRALERQTTDHARAIELKRARGQMVEFYVTAAFCIAGAGILIYWFGG